LLLFFPSNASALGVFFPSNASALYKAIFQKIKSKSWISKKGWKNISFEIKTALPADTIYRRQC